MNYTDYILNVPENTEFALLPEETQSFINTLSPEWPAFPMIYTHSIAGRKLIYVRLGQRLDKTTLEQLFKDYNLDWYVVFIRSAYAETITNEGLPSYIVLFPFNKAILLPFWDDIVEGNINRRPTLEDTLYLSTYAGTDPIEI